MNTMNQQEGSSIIEVIVAILVLSVGMLAYVGLQAEAMQFSKIAQYRTVATQLATDYIDRARGNTTVAQTGSYDFQEGYAALGAPLPVPACPIAGSCTGVELAAQDVALWRNNARLMLPGGSLYAVRDVPVGTAQPIDMWVLWMDPNTGDEAEIGGACPAALGAAIIGLRCLHFRFAL